MADEIDDGGPVFPVRGEQGTVHGMSLRTHISIEAMKGLMQSAYRQIDGYSMDDLTEESYQWADSMIKAEKKSKEKKTDG